MAEETVVAAPSAAEEIPVVEASRGPLVNWTPEQRAEFRKTGAVPKPPEKPKAEESAPSKDQAKPEGEANKSDIEPEADAGTKQQEHGKPPKAKLTADERIAQLEATIEKIRKGAGMERKTEPAPVNQQPQAQPKPQAQVTRPKPTADAKDDKGNPKYETYEDYVEDLADWKAEQRIAEVERTRAAQAQTAQLLAQIEKGKEIYGAKFGEVADEAAGTIAKDPNIPPIVMERLRRSELLPHFLFTQAGDLDSFIAMAKSDPFSALDRIAVTENLIREELAKPKAEDKPESPAPPKTSAPKPPAEVGGRGSTPPDALEAAARAGDFRTFKAEANRRDAARLKG